MVKSNNLTLPKEVGGWGLKEGHLLSHALARISLRSCIKNPSLWREIVLDKYISLDSFTNWIKRKNKFVFNASFH